MNEPEKSTASATVYTVGHGTRLIEELVEVLRSVHVRTIVDVRRFPGSRRNPHLARDALAQALPRHGLRYEWQGEELGGRRTRVPESRHAAWRNAAFQGYADFMETETFRRALRDLVKRATSGEKLAVMCAETLWWRCHRRLIADALLVAGVNAVHLLDGKTAHDHQLHESARIEDDETIVYDVGVDRELL
ncbi:MAG: DUF488 family protein [Actinomycetota bacterium]|nr:DUF488 family protein [Actinomycetota bacterium]